MEIAGLDIYDPIKDEVKSRDIHDIAYWMVDDDYDGSNFVVRQIFFCGGDKDEFDDWKQGLSAIAKAAAKSDRGEVSTEFDPRRVPRRGLACDRDVNDPGTAGSPPTRLSAYG